MALFYFDDYNSVKRALSEIDAKYPGFPAVGVVCYTFAESFDEFQDDLTGFYLATICRLVETAQPGGYSLRLLYSGARRYYLDQIFAKIRDVKKQELTDEQRTAVNVVLLELVNYIYETTGDDGAPYYTI